VAPSIRKKLAITSPTGGGRLVGIVRSQTQTMEFSFNTIWGKIKAFHSLNIFLQYNINLFRVVLEVVLISHYLIHDLFQFHLHFWLVVIKLLVSHVQQLFPNVGAISLYK
jgi:hypothetical protein